MRYLSFLAVIALPLLLLAAPTVRAGPITYQLDDYPASQGGYHIAGTITTDGTLGFIQEANVVAWTFTITDPLGVFVASASSPSIGVIGLFATDTALTTFEFGKVFLFAGDPPTAYIVDFAFEEGSASGTILWHGATPAPIFTYAETTATVPEPTSITLALLGVGALAGAGFARRRRQTAPSQPVSLPAHS